MARRPRLAAQAAAASFRIPAPKLSDNEDDDMLDAPPTDEPTPQNGDDDENVDEDAEEDQEDAPEPEDAPTPSRSERISRSGTPRRRGRPPGANSRARRTRPSMRRADLDDDGNDGASDTTTPRRRGGFRGHRGGRWGKPRGGSTRTMQVPVDDDGNVMNIVGDEVELPDDPEGEEKIDKNGHLQGGREYRVRTFTILGRGNRLYMLSTEPARCIGFRDSYLFFQKHKHLYKIIIDDEEKRDLIDRDLIPHSYKGRAIGVVTARSVFREFGARIVIGGKKVTDDYDVQGAKERGEVEGELAVPEDRLPLPGEPYNRNQYVAWHGASAVYHTGVPSVPLVNGKIVEPKRKRIAVTSDNWMLEHAREASRFNSLLALSRKETENGVYDIHTNLMQEPANFQPTHARWELVLPDRTISNVDSSPHKLRPLPSVYARNFRIHDLHLESAPTATYAKPSSGIQSEDRNDLSSIPTHILDDLPPECRAAFEEAAANEAQWQSKWSTESHDGHRAQFLPSVEWFPK